MVTVIKSAPTQALTPRFCAMGFKLLFFPLDFHFGTRRGGNGRLLTGKLITMKYFCGKHRHTSAPPHNLRSKDTSTPPGVLRWCVGNFPLHWEGDMCVYDGDNRACSTEPPPPQKKEVLQKAFHLPHPKLILSLSSFGHCSKEIQQIQVSKELRQTQSQPHRSLPWDLGVTLGYQLSSPELRDLGIAHGPYFH